MPQITLVEVYIEAGPTGENSADGSAALRRGFESLFQRQRNLLRKRGIKLLLTVFGPRSKAYRKFKSGHDKSVPGMVHALLVDSEEQLPEQGSLNIDARKKHLIARDGWDLKGVKPDAIHLMVQCMESWILADPVVMADYYGKDFHKTKLPPQNNLEQEPKEAIEKKLDAATRDTKKGSYHKVHHASQLLMLIDPEKVRTHCPHYGIFADWLERQGSAN